MATKNSERSVTTSPTEEALPPKPPKKYRKAAKARVEYIGPPKKCRVGELVIVRTRTQPKRDADGAVVMEGGKPVLEEVALKMPIPKMVQHKAKPGDIFELWDHQVEALKERYPGWFRDPKTTAPAASKER